jgi:hypothetical protein
MSERIRAGLHGRVRQGEVRGRLVSRGWRRSQEVGVASRLRGEGEAREKAIDGKHTGKIANVLKILICFFEVKFEI